MFELKFGCVMDYQSLQISLALVFLAEFLAVSVSENICVLTLSFHLYMTGK